MKIALRIGVLALIASLISCSGGAVSSNTQSKTVASATILSMQVAPSTMAISMGGAQQFTATAHLSDGTTQDVTSTAQWSSSDSAIASIDSSGHATGSVSGSVTITAKSGSTTGTALLKVSSAAANLLSIAISPAPSSAPVNTNVQFTATGNYSDGSSADITTLVTWASSTAAATIDASGLAATVAAGTTTISASFASISQSTTL